MTTIIPTTVLRERAKRLQERIARDPDHSELVRIALLDLEHQIEAADFLDNWIARHGGDTCTGGSL